MHFHYCKFWQKKKFRPGNWTPGGRMKIYYVTDYINQNGRAIDKIQKTACELNLYCIWFSFITWSDADNCSMFIDIKFVQTWNSWFFFLRFFQFENSVTVYFGYFWEFKRIFYLCCLFRCLVSWRFFSCFRICFFFFFFFFLFFSLKVRQWCGSRI